MAIISGRGTRTHHISCPWPQADLIIGNFCSIGHNCKIFLGGDHRKDWITTCNLNVYFGLENANPEGHPLTKGNVVIGNDVWIGEDVTIMSGIVIGDGAIIGAGSVVAHNVFPYNIVAGNPASPKGVRFSTKMISALLAIRWWDWDDEKIRRNLDLLLSPLNIETIKRLEEAI